LQQREDFMPLIAGSSSTKPHRPAGPVLDVTGPDPSNIPGVDVGNIAQAGAAAGINSIIDRIERDASGKPSGGSSSVGNDVLTATRTALVEATWKEIAPERDLPLFNAKLETLKTDLGSINAQLGIKLSEKLVRGDDASIQKDPEKKAQTASMNSDAAQVGWLETGGITNLGGGLTTSIPIAAAGGLVKVNLGFSASALLEYQQTSPFALTPDGAIAGVKNAAVTLPINADTARAMKQGSEATFTGNGTASLTAGLTAGISQEFGPVRGGVSAGVTSTGQVQGNFRLDIEKLAGDKVRVLLSTGVDRKAGVSAGIDASITLDGSKLIDDTLGNSFPLDERNAQSVSIEDLAQPGQFADGIIGSLERDGISKVQDAVKTYTAFHAGFGASTEQKHTDSIAYVFDLSNPVAQKAYDNLLRLNESATASAAAQLGSGVTRNEFVDDIDDNSTNASATLAGVKLFLATTLDEEEHGTLDVNGKTEVIRSNKFQREGDDIFTGDESIKWESVAITPQDKPTDTFFHLAFNQTDKMTSHDDFVQFLRFAEAMGVPGATEKENDAPTLDFFHRLFSDKDDTKFAADIYFTNEGLQNIANSTGPNHDDGSEVRAAYIWAATQLDPQFKGMPVNDAASDVLAAQYQQLASNASSAQPDERSSSMQQMQSLAQQYQKNPQSSGRDLAKDAAVILASGDLFQRVKQMGANGDEQGWTQLLVDLGKSKRWDYQTTTLALRAMAGGDQILLHAISIDGGGVKLASKDEGVIKSPDTHTAIAQDGDH
jgi:hypothetical protein